ncbi:cytochrome P450 [Calocera viscosa TUFC12733]|uniref:Cytochrome P450 n=1 Tax=Calocera viscosa (strain TUFC12733) TaxID=1330018 RepID=A0A167I9D5_CALVF|nr:cytochrome P450 [Calocera viscosa TUFC12733]
MASLSLPFALPPYLTPLLLSLLSLYSLTRLTRLLRFLLLPLSSPLRKLAHPPSPSLIWGNMRDILKAPTGVLHAQWEEQFGQVYAYRQLLGRWRLCTTDPRALSHILSNAYAYPKPRQVQQNLARIVGEGLLIAEGDAHRRQRKIMNPSFSLAEIRALTPVFWDKAGELRDIWLRLLPPGADAAGDGAVVDVPKWMSRATLDIIGLDGFGYAFESLTDASNELARAFAALHSIQRPGVFVILMNFFPFLRYLPIKRNKLQAKSMGTMRRVGLELVRRKKEAVRQTLDGKREEKDIGRSQLAGRDLLTALVRANMANDVPASQKMDDEEVLAQISTFLLAGHETTSTAVTWALFALSTHRDVQKKLRDELVSYPDARPGMDELNAIPYLDAFVREVLRFHSPVGGTLRIADADDTIPVSHPYQDAEGFWHTSIRVRKGDGVYIPIKNVNRSPALWGPDGEVFNPDRWASVPEEAGHIPGVWAHVLSFLGGPRACIGYRFSIVEIKVFLYTLVRAFEFEFADPNMEFEERATIVTRPVIKGREKEGAALPLRIRRVESS